MPDKPKGYGVESELVKRSTKRDVRVHVRITPKVRGVLLRYARARGWSLSKAASAAVVVGIEVLQERLHDVSNGS